MRAREKESLSLPPFRPRGTFYEFRVQLARARQPDRSHASWRRGCLIDTRHFIEPPERSSTVAFGEQRRRGAWLGPRAIIECKRRSFCHEQHSRPLKAPCVRRQIARRERDRGYPAGQSE